MKPKCAGSAALTVLAMTTVCLANFSTGDGSSDVGLRPTPNQSASIEAEADAAGSASLDAGTPLVEDGAGRPNPGELGAGLRAVAPSSRLARRKPVPASGDGGVSDRPTPWYRTGIGALAVVLALVGAAYWLVRRWMPSARTVDAGVMKIVGRTGLTPKQTLALVQVGRRYVVVGISPDRLDSLCEISDREEVAELGARIGSHRSESADSFNALLAGESSDYAGGLPAASASPARGRSHAAGSPGSLKDLLSKLRTLHPK